MDDLFSQSILNPFFFFALLWGREGEGKEKKTIASYSGHFMRTWITGKYDFFLRAVIWVRSQGPRLKDKSVNSILAIYFEISPQKTISVRWVEMIC